VNTPTPKSTPPSSKAAPPSGDAYYGADVLGYTNTVGGVRGAPSLPVCGFDGGTFRQYGDAWLSNIAHSSGA
jgi:hypothetical protein